MGGWIGQRIDDFNCSMIEPGQPCVTMTGSAFASFDRTWMK
jgi:hypothetical protein